jgi:hypothetical protein
LRSMAWLPVAASRCLPAAHWPPQVYMQCTPPTYAAPILGRLAAGSTGQCVQEHTWCVTRRPCICQHSQVHACHWFNSLAASLAYNTNCANTLWPQVPVTSHMLGDSTGHKARAPAAARSQHATAAQRHLTCLLQLMRLESSCPVAAVQLVCV